MSRVFKILALDGGGYRGVYSAHILNCMQEKLDVDWTNDFDLISGTSTGAILAAGLVCGKTPAQILTLYETHGASIFKKNAFRRFGILSSRYKSDAMRSVLRDILGEQTLGDITFPLIIPATDVGNSCVHLFKSAYQSEFVRDSNVLVSDAVLASCSAPTFFDPQQIGNYLIADGGLWANSPSLVALVEAKRRFGQELNDIRILTIGTGVGKSVYPLKKTKASRLYGWGFGTKWGHQKFISMILNLQAESANNTVKLLLREDQILRINFESDSELPLDDTSNYDDLVTKADHDFAHNTEAISAFLA